MLKSIERNYNIDTLSKNLNNNLSENKSLKLVKNIIIESNQDFKKTGGVNRLSYSRLLIKRSNVKLSKIFGQKFKLIKANKSVSNWNLREEMLVGNLVTIGDKEGLENIYKWLLIYLARDLPETLIEKNVKSKYVQKKQSNFGISERRSEFIILLSDWISGDIIEKTLGVERELAERAKEELLKLKMLNLGINIKINFVQKGNNGWEHSYLLLP